MAERLTAAALPPTADSDGAPEVSLASGEAHIRYRFDSTMTVELRFFGVIGFEWNEERISRPSMRDDLSYEVLDSEWLAAHVAVDVTRHGQPYRHFIINFNEPKMGSLEVLCLRVEWSRSPTA